jgi:hypothetical protein
VGLEIFQSEFRNEVSATGFSFKILLRRLEVGMSGGDEYRARAADFSARAKAEKNPGMRAELESLALSYLRLADQADRNATADIVYETPTPAEQPAQQQQQQQQPQRRDDDAEN